MQSRLLIWVLGLSTAVWLGAASMTWFDARHEVDELLDGHLAQAAALLSVQADGDDDDIADAPVLHRYAPKVAFQVYIHGQLITRSLNVGREPMSPVASGFSTIDSTEGGQWRVFATSIPQRFVQIYVGERTESRDAIVMAVTRSTLTPLIISLPLLALLGFWSVRWGLMPLRRLSAKLARREPHSTEALNSRNLPTELLPLAQALNTLFDRIGRMVEMERRFTADAAHELRTPIAAIRAQAQVALGAGEDAAQRVHALHATLAGCDRASRLVDQLLTLARLEVPSEARSGKCDLVQVVRCVAAELAPAALAAGQTLELHVDGPVLLVANDTLLGVLVRNIVDNALRYSPKGSSVEIRVSEREGCAQLDIDDSGAGMTDEQIQRLGERFYRVLGNDSAGSGLGWSIIRRLIEVFEASLQVGRSERLGGLAVHVSWPRAR